MGLFRGAALVICLFIGWSTAFIFKPDPVKFSGNGETPDDWRVFAKKNILRKATQKPQIGVAKNVILFLGDGMSIPTITATRILKGQLHNKTGEETVLSYESFPYTGLSKTYAQDFQVTDSAASGTSYLCGVKTNQGTIGVDARTIYENCTSQKGAELTSILDWSMAAGKSVGFVTTTRVTHATPACLYAQAASRWWEGDHYTSGLVGGCKDIAAQLIDDYENVQVIMGGGRRFFMRYDQRDPEHGSNAHYGRRDGRDLIEEWKQKQHVLGRTAHYVWKESDFNNVNPATTDSLLGLFEYSHMNYDYERTDPNHEVAGEPSLQEMTAKAIQILSKNPKGFFLLVEGGKIDLAHHGGKVKIALYDSLAFDAAVAKADQITNDDETLIVVTADHSHTLSMAGYPSRGNPIFGKVDDGKGHYALAQDGHPYTSLTYADGPGAVYSHGIRPDITHVDTADKHYLPQATVPTSLEHHGGDDVAIFTKGPMSHLLGGVHEQNEIAHAMAYASCVGDYSQQSNCAASLVSS